jgi:hypothetical protein
MTHADADDYAERETKRHRAAAQLAIAASRLRDADDALVAHGRKIREGDADRGMPDLDEAEEADRLAKGVATCYAGMRMAEREYEGLS